MRLFSSALILIAASMWANTGNAAVCAEGSPEERLACLTRTHCPVVVTASDKADCYRRITLDLLGIQKLDQPAVASPAAAVTQTPAAPAVAEAQPVAPSPPAAPVATTTTAAQISEQNRQSSVSAAEEQDNFGYEWHEAPREEKIVREINSRIVFLDTLAHGNYLIGLENGQLWLQIAKSRTRLKEGGKVRIVRGSLRSFKLFPEKSSATNVSRVVCHGDDPSSLCRLFEDWQQAQD